MPALLLNGLRTAAQYVVTALVAWLAHLGIPVPEALQNWFAQTVLFAGAVAGITMGLRWLETRQGDSIWPRLARWVARVLMLGLSGRQPVYLSGVERAATPPAPPVQRG